MLIRTSHDYDAPVDEVLRVMTDEDELRVKYAGEPDGGLVSYQRRDLDGTVEITQVRVVRFPVAPEAAKVLVPEPRIHQVEWWEPLDPEGGRRATVELRSPGLPVHGVCHVSLRPMRDGRTRAETTVDLTCDVPVIGGRILDAVARSARDVIERDAVANADALVRRRAVAS